MRVPAKDQNAKTKLRAAAQTVCKQRPAQYVLRCVLQDSHKGEPAESGSAARRGFSPVGARARSDLVANQLTDAELTKTAAP